MTNFSMGSKRIVLSLALCLLLSSLHEVSCQADGSYTDFTTLDNEQELKSSIKKEMSESERNYEQSNTISEEKKTSSSRSFETEAETVSSQSSSMMDKINREIEAHFGDLNEQAGSYGVNQLGESMDAFQSDGERQKQLEDIERQMEVRVATAPIRTSPTINLTPKIEGEYKGSSESSQQSSSTYIGGSRILGSLGISQPSGMWRCVNQDKNGVTEGEDASIVIPKYDFDTIIKEESISRGSESQTSSLLNSLTQIVNNHPKLIWSRGITTETSSKETSETVEKLKTTLKSYRNIKVHDLVTRSDFEEILTMAARYEELSSASISYISKLTMYKSVIQEGIKASQRVKLVQQRARLLKDMAMEKQKRVDAEFALVKSLAQRGDALYVKIFAIKKLVVKLEAEKVEVDLSFKKIVVNLSRVLEESSKAYEEYHVVVRKWKEEQATEEFSREAIESAESVWVQFLSSL
ncbi:unnamed protein product [Cochlearia groenlandica]